MRSEPLALAGLALLACSANRPVEETATPSNETAVVSSAADMWKADGPFPQVRYYVIADT